MTARVLICSIIAITFPLAGFAGDRDEQAIARKARARYLINQIHELKKDAIRRQIESARRLGWTSAPGAPTATGSARHRDLGRLHVELEPNDEIGGAMGLPLLAPEVREFGTARANGPTNTVIVATIDPAGDIDYYSFRLRAGDVLRVDLDSDKEGTELDLVVRVFGPIPETPADPFDCGPPVAERDDGNGLAGGSLDPCAMFEAPEDGLYAIEVATFLPEEGGPGQAYIMNLTVRSGEEAEPNDDPDTTTNVLLPKPPAQPTTSFSSARVSRAESTAFGGVIDPDGDRDCYLVALEPGDVLNVDVDAFKCANFLGLLDFLDPTLSLYDPGGDLVAFNDDAEDLDSGILYSASASGDHVLCVDDFFLTGSPNHLYELIAEIHPNNECPDSSSSCRGCRLALSYLLILDRDTLEERTPAIQPIAASLGVEPATLVNADIAREGLAEPLPIPVGTVLTLATRQGGKAGVLSPFLGQLPGDQVFPDRLAEYVDGLVPERQLRRQEGVGPIEPLDLYELEGSTICAVVHDGDIKVKTDPLRADLGGRRLGLLGFVINEVFETVPAEPLITVEVVDAASACASPGLFDFGL